MKGAIVDPVWNFCPKAGQTWTNDADRILEYVRRTGIEVEWILDTHPHADHFTAAVYLSEQLGGVPRGKRLRQHEVLAVYEKGRFLPISVTFADITGRDVEVDTRRFADWLVIAFIAAVMVLIAFDYPVGTYTLVAMIAVIPFLVIGWFVVRDRVREIAAARDGYTGTYPVVGTSPGQELLTQRSHRPEDPRRAASTDHDETLGDR